MEKPSFAAFFTTTGCVGTLATCSSDGSPNAAIFGSALLLDAGHLAMALGDNRSLRNLGQNPRAVFLIALPGANLPAWRGVRLYLTLTRVDREGALLERMRADVAARAGRSAARMIQAAAVFHIDASRPLFDLGR